MDLSMLNPEQRQAAETLEGPVLILAGAGSGKTRALTYRVANLMDHGVPAWSILALTFTNKAAREMKERITQLVGEKAESAWISTFHSTCARILRRDIEKLGYTRSFTIYDDDDQGTVIKEILKRLNIDEKFLPPREVKAKISDAKNKLMGPDEWFAKTERDFRNQTLHDVFVAYEQRLKSANALDFDDLLLKTLELLADHPPVLESYRDRFHYVMVDEYQDTNYAQYMLVKLLTDKSRNLCVVGDDDQSIYGWRGADIRNILDFEKDYPDAKVIKLEQNYRSTANILDAANQVIAHNAGRKEKALWTEAGAGETIKLYCAGDEREEAAWVADRIRKMNRHGEEYGRMAVLYRTNAQSRVLEEMLMEEYDFGGEQSGHIIFRDFATTGDGQLTAIQLLSLLRREGKKLSDLSGIIQRYPQCMINIRVSPEGKLAFYTNPEVKAAIDRAKKTLGRDGRVVVRVSGTEPLIRVMTEGADQHTIEQVAGEVAAVVREQLCPAG